MRRRNSHARESAAQAREPACTVQNCSLDHPGMHCASSDSPWAISQSFLQRNRSRQTIRQSFDGFANRPTSDKLGLSEPPPLPLRLVARHLSLRAAARGHCQCATGSVSGDFNLFNLILSFTFKLKALMSDGHWQ